MASVEFPLVVSLLLAIQAPVDYIKNLYDLQKWNAASALPPKLYL